MKSIWLGLFVYLSRLSGLCFKWSRRTVWRHSNFVNGNMNSFSLLLRLPCNTILLTRSILIYYFVQLCNICFKCIIGRIRLFLCCWRWWNFWDYNFWVKFFCCLRQVFLVDWGEWDLFVENSTVFLSDWNFCLCIFVICLRYGNWLCGLRLESCRLYWLGIPQMHGCQLLQRWFRYLCLLPFLWKSPLLSRNLCWYLFHLKLCGLFNLILSIWITWRIVLFFYFMTCVAYLLRMPSSGGWRN